jgi:DNA-binding NtrC family response regulator
MATILVVDDEPSIVRLVSQLLTREGHRVVGAANAEEAVASLETARPDVAIVDLVMPGKGGMTLIMDDLRHVPDLGIVAMSGRIPLGGDSFASFSAQFGVSSFLLKPFSSADLAKAVNQALTKREERQ